MSRRYGEKVTKEKQKVMQDMYDRGVPMSK